MTKNSIKAFFLVLKVIIYLFLFDITSSKAQIALEAIVTKVYDGDTIEISTGDKVRYIGIDAPELHKKSDGFWEEINEPFAKEAFEKNKALVYGKKVKLVFDKEKKDRYGRLLCYVFIDNIFVNELLLSEALAFPYIKPPNTYFKKRLLDAFKKAFLSRKNLFSSVIKPSEINFYIGKEVWYTGKIRNIIIGNKKAEIFTDYLIIDAPKSSIKKLNIYYGLNIYAYGKLTKKHERIRLIVKKPSHLVLE